MGDYEGKNYYHNFPASFQSAFIWFLFLKEF